MRTVSAICLKKIRIKKKEPKNNKRSAFIRKGRNKYRRPYFIKKGYDFTMPELKCTQYSQWENANEHFIACHECRKNGDAHFGTMMKRRIFERGGEMHTEYKVVCLGCKRQTTAHRSKMIAIKEWEGKNQPGDGLRYRSRTPNIALNREAEILKGDDSNGLKKSTDKI